MTNRYIDPSATNDGDGTTAAQAGSPGGTGARNQFALADYAGGTTWDIWIRRSGMLTVAADVTLNQADIHLLGWPKSTDSNYGGRPASGTSNGWDGDSADYAVFSCTNSTKKVTMPSGTGQQVKRCDFSNTGDPTGSSAIWWENNVTATFENSRFYFRMGSGGTSTAFKAKSSTANAYDLASTFDGCTFETTRGGTALLSEFNSCTYRTCTRKNSSSTASGVLTHIKDGDQQLHEDCSDTVTSGTSHQTLLKVSLSTNTKVSRPCFIGCAFDLGTAAIVAAYGSTLDIQAAVAMHSCTFRGAKITFQASALPAPEWDTATYPLHFTDMTFTGSVGGLAGTSAIDCQLPCEVVGNNFTVGLHYFYQTISGIAGSRFVLKNAKFSYPVNGNTTESPPRTENPALYDYPGVLSYDHDGNTGLFANWNDPNGLQSCVTDATEPNGIGISCALGYNLQGPCNRSIPGEAGDHDGILLRLAAGARTVRMFYKESCSSYQAWATVYYLDGATGAHRAVAHCFSLGMTPTGFSWAHQDFSFTVGQDGIALVKFYIMDNCGGGGSVSPKLLVVS